MKTDHHGTLVRGKSTHRHRRNEQVEEPTEVKGGFRVALNTGLWWWSPGMFTLHGYRGRHAITTVPTTKLVIGHRHPDDRRAMADAWAHLVAEGGLVAFHYRIIGADGVIRPVFAMASTCNHTGRAPTVVTGVMQLESTTQ